MAIYKDREDAGRVLSQELADLQDQGNTVILALPRGGVPVGFEVARKLNAPLDVFIVRKLGVPGHEELAMGAIASGGVIVLNDEVVWRLNIPTQMIEGVIREERREMERRERAYRDDRPPVDVSGKTAILVDDGLATGASMKAAVQGLRARGPARIIVAVPVAAPETCASFQELVDRIVCAETPEPFFGVGAWYEDFSQTSDEEVRDLLERSREYTATGENQ